MFNEAPPLPVRRAIASLAVLAWVGSASVNFRHGYWFPGSVEAMCAAITAMAMFAHAAQSASTKAAPPRAPPPPPQRERRVAAVQVQRVAAKVYGGPFDGVLLPITGEFVHLEREGSAGRALYQLSSRDGAGTYEYVATVHADAGTATGGTASC